MTNLDSVTAEVRAWYDVYFEASRRVFSGEHADPELWIQYYAAPLTVAGDDGFRILPDRASISARMAPTVETVRRANYHHSEIHRLDVHPLNHGAALIEGEFSRHDRDGKEFARFQSSYLAARLPEGWRFLVPFPPPA